MPPLTEQDLLDQRELIQNDLDCVLDGIDQQILDNVCQVVVDRFKILIGQCELNSKKDVMRKEVRAEIVLHGLRWATNILVEILANHAAAVSESGRKFLTEAVGKLEEAAAEFRKKT